jgi:ribosome-associated protein
MPKFATDLETLKREAEVSFLRRGGPGGQHQNKTETAVRIHHPPSGVLLVVNTHRSQSANKAEAFERLKAELEKINHVPKTRRATRPSRRAKRRRMDTKSQRGEIKKGRKKPTPQD